MARIFKIYEHEVAGVRVKRTFLWLPKRLYLHCMTDINEVRWLCFANLAQQKEVRIDSKGFGFYRWVSVAWVDSENDLKDLFKSITHLSILPRIKEESRFLWLPRRLYNFTKGSKQTKWLTRATIRYRYDFKKLKFKPDSWTFR